MGRSAIAPRLPLVSEPFPTLIELGARPVNAVGWYNLTCLAANRWWEDRNRAFFLTEGQWLVAWRLGFCREQYTASHPCASQPLRENCGKTFHLIEPPPFQVFYPYSTPSPPASIPNFCHFFDQFLVYTGVNTPAAQAIYTNCATFCAPTRRRAFAR